MPVADPPLVRAVNRSRDDGHVLLESDHRRTRLHSARNTAELPRPFREETERVTVAHRLAHQPHRLAIRFAAADGDRSEAADQLAEPRHAMRLDLREEVDGPRRGGAHHGRVDPVEVVEGEHDAAGARDPLDAVGAQWDEEPGERLEGDAADRPHGVDPVHRGSVHAGAAYVRTSCSIRATTSSTARSVVSI